VPLIARAARIAGLTALACAAFGARPAAADPFDACVSAYEQGQVDRAHDKLIKARSELLSCTESACPAAIRKDCSRWLDEVDAAMPTVVVEAHAANGTDVTDFRVLVDGVALASASQGKAVPIDPGVHVVRYETRDGPRVEQKITIREGEKNRRLHVDFPAPDAPRSSAAPLPVPPPPTTSRPTPPLVFVLGGVGLVGVGSFAAFGIWSKVSESKLNDSGCKPHCDVNAVFREEVAADVSLGIGAAALIAATIVYLARPARPTSTTSARRPAILAVQF
jgi:hypothetical protein